MNSDSSILRGAEILRKQLFRNNNVGTTGAGGTGEIGAVTNGNKQRRYRHGRGYGRHVQGHTELVDELKPSEITRSFSSDEWSDPWQPLVKSFQQRSPDFSPTKTESSKGSSDAAGEEEQSKNIEEIKGWDNRSNDSGYSFPAVGDAAQWAYISPPREIHKSQHLYSPRSSKYFPQISNDADGLLTAGKEGSLRIISKKTDVTGNTMDDHEQSLDRFGAFDDNNTRGTEEMRQMMQREGLDWHKFMNHENDNDVNSDKDNFRSEETIGAPAKDVVDSPNGVNKYRGPQFERRLQRYSTRSTSKSQISDQRTTSSGESSEQVPVLTTKQDFSPRSKLSGQSTGSGESSEHIQTMQFAFGGEAPFSKIQPSGVPPSKNPSENPSEDFPPANAPSKGIPSGDAMSEDNLPRDSPPGDIPSEYSLSGPSTDSGIQLRYIPSQYIPSTGVPSTRTEPAEIEVEGEGDCNSDSHGDIHVVSPLSQQYGNLLGKSPAFQHAINAGALWQSLVSQHVRFPSDWWNNDRKPPLGSKHANHRWQYFDRYRVEADPVLCHFVHHRSSPGRLLLHIIVQDFMTFQPVMDVAIGCFHPNARGVRETKDHDPKDEDCRDVFMATRKRIDDVSVLDPLLAPSSVANKSSVLRGSNIVANCESPLEASKYAICNHNVRSVFGEKPPLQTIFLSESIVYERLSSTHEESSENGHAVLLLQDYLFPNTGDVQPNPDA